MRFRVIEGVGRLRVEKLFGKRSDVDLAVLLAEQRHLFGEILQLADISRIRIAHHNLFGGWGEP